MIGRETRPEDITQEDFDSYISAAADAISPFDYEIRSTRHQVTQKRIYALVNSVSDPLTQIATTRTNEELFYIRRLLNAMFETYNGKREIMAITSMQALGGIRKPERQTIGGGGSQQQSDKGLTQSETEKLLSNLVTENWLERSKEGFYTLSPRALMELSSWLVETYNDEDEEERRIKNCEACKEIVTVGQRCANQDCQVRLHNICDTAFWNSRPSKKCPRCKTAWDGNHFVGQKVVTTTDEHLRNKRKNVSGAKKSRPLAVEQEEEEEEPVTESSSRGRRTRNQTPITPIIPEPEDESEEEPDGEPDQDMSEDE